MPWDFAIPKDAAFPKNAVAPKNTAPESPKAPVPKAPVKVPEPGTPKPKVPVPKAPARRDVAVPKDFVVHMLRAPEASVSKCAAVSRDGVLRKHPVVPGGTFLKAFVPKNTNRTEDATMRKDAVKPEAATMPEDVFASISKVLDKDLFIPNNVFVPVVTSSHCFNMYDLGLDATTSPEGTVDERKSLVRADKDSADKGGP